MFRLSTGPFSTLEKIFLTDLLEIRKNDSLSSLLVLSPSGRLLSHLQSRLSQENAGFLNIHCLTFYALAERLLAGADYKEMTVTEPALYEEMIRQVLVGVKPEPVDRAIRDALRLEGKPVSRGLAGALASTMKDLRDAAMRADKALEAAQEGFLGKEAPEAASTLALYARLVGLFEKHGLRSSADLLRRAAKIAPSHPWLRRQKAIFLYGFYDLTGVQLDLILALANHPNVTVYFPYEEGNPAYAYAEKLLKDPAFVSKCSSTPSSPAAAGGGPMDRPPTIAGDDGKSASVDVWSCSGARDEVWLAAKTILKLADEGTAFADMAVVARNLGTYTAPLREIFDAHEIPYVSSRREPAGTHPLVKTVHALLFFDPKHPNAKILRKDLENSAYYRATSPGVAGRNEETSSWLSHIAWAKNLIGQGIHLPHKANAEETALLESLLSVLDDMQVLDVLGNRVPRRYFLDVYLENLKGLERPGPANDHAGVQVLEVQQARGLSFGAVILLGMNEKVFPRLIREDPFLSDAARSALAQTTGCRLGRKLDGYEEERFLFELMRQAARRHFYLFTQRSNDEGKALIPSVYLKDLERSVPALNEERLPRAHPDKLEKAHPMTWTPKELSFLVNRAHLDPSLIYAALRWDSKGFDRLLATHFALEAFAPGIGPYDGLLKDKSLVKTRLDSPFSPSGLEDLAECPFQYYAGHILGLRAEEDLAPEGEITAKALGQLFHKTLELFYSACRDGVWPADDGALSKSLEEALEGCFQAFKEPLSAVYPLALRSSKELIFKELLAFIKNELEELKATGFTPRWLEQPLEGMLPRGDLPYRFFGKPDRLDTNEGRGTTLVRVVDYKSGKPKTQIGKIETEIIRGKFLQLPIYLGLAAQFAEKTLGKKVIATDATLASVRKTDLQDTKKILTGSFWDSLSANIFIENIKELIGLIEKESFYIHPSTSDVGYCTRCDFSHICRKEHMPTRLRAERDPLRQRVVEKLGRTAPATPKSVIPGDRRPSCAPIIPRNGTARTRRE